VAPDPTVSRTLAVLAGDVTAALAVIDSARAAARARVWALAGEHAPDAGTCAASQTARAGRLLRDLNLDAHLIATSDDWGAEKPTAALFDKLISSVGLHPAQIAYVGDRVDNDIRPAKASGMFTAFLRRGPWGYVATDEQAAAAHTSITTLAMLGGVLPG
jgi:phosphoglycolate phosphatase-like HAD superfamily hydrolase